jgi:hypothetical protein
VIERDVVPTFSVADRAGPEFDCTDTPNEPFPEAEPADTVTQAGAPVTDHAHPASAETEISWFPPPASTLTLVGASV